MKKNGYCTDRGILNEGGGGVGGGTLGREDECSEREREREKSVTGGTKRLFNPHVSKQKG